jgi:hypothetical protein
MPAAPVAGTYAPNAEGVCSVALTAAACAIGFAARAHSRAQLELVPASE